MYIFVRGLCPVSVALVLYRWPLSCISGLCPVSVAFVLYRWPLSCISGLCPVLVAFVLYRCCFLLYLWWCYMTPFIINVFTLDVFKLKRRNIKLPGYIWYINLQYTFVVWFISLTHLWFGILGQTVLSHVIF